MTNINIKFGKQLKELRKKKKLTQEKLAQLADINYKYIQRLEGKSPSSPTLNVLEKLAKTFNVPLSKLVEFE